MDPAFQTLTVDQLKTAAESVCRLVAERQGRAEVRDRGGRVCVVISKVELDAMDAALRLLARCSKARRFCRSAARRVRADDDCRPPEAATIA